MTVHARIVSGVVAEILAPVEGLSLEECFPASLLADVVDAPDKVQPGWTYDGKTFAAAANAPVDLAALKAGLKIQVDAVAESLRLTLITPGSGQAMEYQEAYAQAQAALAAGDDAKASGYPMLAVTIGVDIDPKTGKPATDVLGVARSVKAAYEAYLLAGAAIRGARLLAKAEIEAAADADLAQAVFAAIKWPTFGA